MTWIMLRVLTDSIMAVRTGAITILTIIITATVRGMATAYTDLM